MGLFRMRIGSVAGTSGWDPSVPLDIVEILKNGGDLELADYGLAALTALWDTTWIDVDGVEIDPFTLPTGFTPTAAAVRLTDWAGLPFYIRPVVEESQFPSTCVTAADPVTGDAEDLAQTEDPIGTTFVTSDILIKHTAPCTPSSGADFKVNYTPDTFPDPGGSTGWMLVYSPRLRGVDPNPPTGGQDAHVSVFLIVAASGSSIGYTTIDAPFVDPPLEFEIPSAHIDSWRASGFTNAHFRIFTQYTRTALDPGVNSIISDLALLVIRVDGTPAPTIDMESPLIGGGSASGDDVVTPGIVYDFGIFPAPTIDDLFSVGNAITIDVDATKKSYITGPLELTGVYELLIGQYDWYIKAEEEILNGEPTIVVEDIIDVLDTEEPPEGYELYGSQEDYPDGPIFVWWVLIEPAGDSFWINSPISPGPAWMLYGSVPSCPSCILLTLMELEILIADASGVYFLQPNKRTDTLYERDEPGGEQIDTVVTKIPDPRATTGDLP